MRVLSWTGALCKTVEVHLLSRHMGSSGPFLMTQA